MYISNEHIAFSLWWVVCVWCDYTVLAHTHLLCHTATTSVRWWMLTSTRCRVKVTARLRYAEMSIRFLHTDHVWDDNRSTYTE